MKQCTGCGNVKSLDSFVTDKRLKSGKASKCRACQAAYRASYYAANREKAKAYATQWARQNSDRVKEYRNQNKDRLNASARAWKEANAAYVKEKEREYRANNREAIRAKKAKARANSRDAARARTSAWAKANPDRKRANQGKRRATKIQRTPVWADAALAEQVYAYAKWLEQLVGAPCHVDHIVPLQGGEASGLHCAHNLRVLTESENTSKGNRVDPDSHHLPSALDDEGFRAFLRDKR